MTKNKANTLLRTRNSSVEIDAAELIIPGRLFEWKLQLPDRPNKVVVVFEDTDGKKMVIDGRHVTERAKRRNGTVRAVFVQENDMVGRQTALERLLGMISHEKEK